MTHLRRHPLLRHGGLIFIGQMLLLLLVPFVDQGEVRFPFRMFAAAIAVSAVTVLLLGQRRPALVLATISGLAAAGLLVSGQSLQIRLPGTIVLIVVFLWASSLSVRHAFSAEIDATQRILCGAASYVMLGFVFAVLHTLLGLRVPGSYVLTESLEGTRSVRWTDFLWLSFSTLTTAGYGDLAPVGRWSNTLCTLEPLCGILFPATLIARIASLPAADGRALTAPPSSTPPARPFAWRHRTARPRSGP